MRGPDFNRLKEHVEKRVKHKISISDFTRALFDKTCPWSIERWYKEEDTYTKLHIDTQYAKIVHRSVSLCTFAAIEAETVLMNLTRGQHNTIGGQLVIWIGVYWQPMANWCLCHDYWSLGGKWTCPLPDAPQKEWGMYRKKMIEYIATDQCCCFNPGL